MSLAPLSESLGRWQARKQVTRQLGATRVIARANAHAAGRFRALWFRSGILMLAIPSAEQRYLLRGTEADLMRDLNAEFGESAVRTIRYRVDPSRLAD